MSIHVLTLRKADASLTAIEHGDTTTSVSAGGEAGGLVSLPLLVPWLVQGLVIAGAGAVLFFTPTVGRDIWGWELTPFNTRFLGAIYLAALVPFLALAVLRRWTFARVVVPMDLLFMSVVLAASLAYVDRFKWERPVTWAWFLIFVSVPVYTAYLVVRLRTLRPAAPEPTRPGVRLGLGAAAVPLAGYGIALLAAPATVTAFWPWPVDGFHGRVYSAIFVTLALAAAIAAHGSAPTDRTTLGLTLVALGALEPIGLVVVDASVDKVDWSTPGTWVWIAMFAAMVAAGIALAITGGRRHEVLRDAAPSSRAAPRPS